ncbi:PH domain-containing protein [Corynebacterium sp. USCH3]|uniref:PH domain-containing protein n=1 Tax=Corynebacterium sp. USCH3 TaxID=3024840 RepID=UPI0030AAA426
MTPVTPDSAGAAWHRVHPLSPLLRMWAVLVGLAAVLAAQQAETLGRLRDLLDDSPLPTGLIVVIVLVAIPVVFLLGWVVSLPWWKATGYRIDDEEIAVRRGVVSRQLRTARFDRVQAVDLVEPLAPRLFRLAGVKVETAGGSGSSVRVEYLTRRDAEALRGRLLALVRGTPEQADDQSDREPASAGIGTAAGIVVPTIPITRSLVAAALSGATGLVVAGVTVAAATPAGLAVLLPVVAGAVPWVWGVLNTSWRFTANLSGDVLGITFGLTERRRQSVPLERVHAVEVSQPVAWRLLGWWRVRVDVAGYGAESDSAGSTTTVLPVGDLTTALHVLGILTPLTVPEIEAVAHPQGHEVGSVPGNRQYLSPRSARWVSPVDRTRQGTTLVTRAGGDGQVTAVVSRRGRFRRVVAVISPAHIQELSYHRGPAQRMLGVAGVRFDLVPGPVSMAGRDLSTDDAVDLVTRLRGRRLPGPTSHR